MEENTMHATDIINLLANILNSAHVALYIPSSMTLCRKGSYTSESVPLRACVRKVVTYIIATIIIPAHARTVHMESIEVSGKGFYIFVIFHPM